MPHGLRRLRSPEPVTCSSSDDEMDCLDDIADESRLPYLPATPALQKQAPFKASLQLLKFPAAILFPEGAALLIKIPGPAEILRHPVAELVKHAEILAGLPAGPIVKVMPLLKILGCAVTQSIADAQEAAAHAVLEIAALIKSLHGLPVVLLHALPVVEHGSQIAAVPGTIQTASFGIQRPCLLVIPFDVLSGEEDIATPETALAVFEGTALLIIGNSLRQILSRAGAFL